MVLTIRAHRSIVLSEKSGESAVMSQVKEEGARSHSVERLSSPQECTR